MIPRHIVEGRLIREDAVSCRNSAKGVRQILNAREALEDQPLDYEFRIHLGDARRLGDGFVPQAYKTMRSVVLVLRSPQDLVNGLLGVSHGILRFPDAAHPRCREDSLFPLGDPEVPMRARLDNNRYWSNRDGI